MTMIVHPRILLNLEDYMGQHSPCQTRRPPLAGGWSALGAAGGADRMGGTAGAGKRVLPIG